MPSIAKVIVDLALNREFDYLIPDDLRGRLQPGWRVVVPFGKRETTGFVVALADTSTFDKLKPITGVVGDVPLVSDRLLELARWMAEYYCCPVETAVKSVLPEAIRREEEGWRERMFVSVQPLRDRGDVDTTPTGAMPAISTHSSAVLVSVPIHITSERTTCGSVNGFSGISVDCVSSAIAAYGHII